MTAKGPQPSLFEERNCEVAEMSPQQQVNSVEGDNLSKIDISIDDIQEAYQLIKKDISITPLLKPQYVGKKFCNLYFKCENFQVTGSFKARGACNVLSRMPVPVKSKGCTVAGGRNFLYAMTHYGYKYSMIMNVMVPKDCSLSDRQRYKENSAIVKIHGYDINDASLHALSYSDEIGSNYIHGSDRLDLIAGYATMGLEILHQLDHIDAILCPVGCGDLVASLVLTVKNFKPDCLIYGIESAASPAMSRALQEGKPIMINANPTLADSAAKNIASTNAYHLVKAYMNRIITIEDMWIFRAMLNILDREKMVVEGAAALPVAAIMAGRVPELKGKNVVCIISGGNVTPARWSGIVERGLATEGKLVRCVVGAPDTPGALARLLTRVADVGGDVRSFHHERSAVLNSIFMTYVNLLIETADAQHARELEKKLLKEYPQTRFVQNPHIS